MPHGARWSSGDLVPTTASFAYSIDVYLAHDDSRPVPSAPALRREGLTLSDGAAQGERAPGRLLRGRSTSFVARTTPEWMYTLKDQLVT